MFNLLVISPQDDARRRIDPLLSEATARVSFKQDAADAASLVQRGLFDAILVLAAGASEHTLDEIRALRRSRPEGLIAVLVDRAPLAWEESALGAGADVVLREPISGAHLENLLRRFAATNVPAPLSPASPPSALVRGTPPGSSRGPLEILRDFSHILGYSLDHKLFAEHFAAKVRNIVGVARIAVFLEGPRESLTGGSTSTRLSCAAAIGIPADIIECFELSRTSGIGARLAQHPQILQSSTEAGSLLGTLDQKMQREFEILGCEVAIPITDRTRTIGVAMLGGHFTGRPFTADELQLLFLLMEELGSALKNTWLHQQVTAGHRLLADVLATLSSGCLVLDRNLQVLHANRAMLLFVKGAEANPKHRLEFSDLPQKLANPLYDTVVKGAAAQPFFFTAGVNGERLYHASIIPFHATGGSLPQTAMLVLEDFTQIEAAKRFEVEASKTKLIALIAKRFAHEIRNSLVPLATHEQLLESEYQNDDFRRSLKTALTRETHRIQRFTEQMLYLAQPARTPVDVVNVRDLIEICFRKAGGSATPPGRLQLRTSGPDALVRCHQPALEHAFQEIFTNALQANPDDPVVTVNIETEAPGMIRTTVRDSGAGFTEDTARQATEPFFTTRNTGIGLGLTVARKIVEDHHGRFTVAPRTAKRDFDVEVTLPAADGM